MGHVRPMSAFSGKWTSRASRQCSPMTRNFRRPFSSGLVPFHPLGAGLHGVVVPLEPQLLLAKHVGLEALPGLELEVVERTALGAEPMRYARGEKHQRAGFDFLGVVADLDHAPSLERDVAVGGAIRVGVRTEVLMIG